MKNEVVNSCLMLTVNLDTPVDLSCIFDSGDLKDTGIEFDYHVTLMYAQGKNIPRENILNDITEILGNEYKVLSDFMKNTSPTLELMDFFELGSFENDSDYVVLKMKPKSSIFSYLQRINTGICDKYGITSDFKNYTPHITLAELNPGTAGRYVNSNSLNSILKDSTVSFEDFMMSYGGDNEVEDRKQYYLTQNNCIDRFFRIKRLKESYAELDVE